MSDATTLAVDEVRRVLDAYLPTESRIDIYADFLSGDPRSLTVAEPTDIAMLIATFEGECKNPPVEALTAASVAAWAYIQAGAIPSLTRADFMASVQTLLAKSASDQSGVLLAREAVEGLAQGYSLMTEALEEGEVDSLLSRAFEGVAGLLDAVLSRADLDYEATYEGTVVVESVMVDWLLDATQGVLDYAATLLSLDGLDVSVRDGLDDAVASLSPAFTEFIEDAG